MKKGDIVTIYEDPITKKNPEGKAKLVNRLDEDSIWTGEYLIDVWSVRFLGEKTLYFRRLLAERR